MKLFTFKSITFAKFQEEKGYINLNKNLHLSEFENIYKVIASTLDIAKEKLSEKASREVQVSHTIDAYQEFELIKEEELTEGMVL